MPHRGKLAQVAAQWGYKFLHCSSGYHGASIGEGLPSAEAAQEGPVSASIPEDQREELIEARSL
eukprot:5738451-Alexandrium_andersonii.AAC.1